jgi:ABC-type cobalamin/Fe3+-siderophores transport system ATPase subunit
MGTKIANKKTGRLKGPLTVVLGLFLVAGLLYGASIKVLYPNGGEVLKTNTRVHIKWQSKDLNGKVVIVLYKKGIKHEVIAKQTHNSGKFPWKIPQHLPEGNDYRIRIRALNNLAVNDFSDRNFTIKR